MALGDKSNMCLQWWREVLCCRLRKQDQPQDESTMGFTWVEGNGSEAGKSFNLVFKAQISHKITLDV